jgi:uncharacterized protein
MHRNFEFLLILFVLIILIDWYAYQSFKTVFAVFSFSTRRIVNFSFWLITILSLISVIASFFTDFYRWPAGIRIYLVSFLFIIYLSKLLILPFLFVDDLHRLVKWLINIYYKGIEGTAGGGLGTRYFRSLFLNQLAIVLSTIPFMTLIYGILIGGYDLRVWKTRLKKANVPASFNGLRIVQVSDIHCGSFIFNQPLKDAARIISNLKPDIIFFTGDLVNYKTDEAVRFKKFLSQLNAPLGVFSVLGNHDYGDYLTWKNIEEKQANFERMIDLHREMGWTLLRNENALISRNGESIAIIGSENWGARGRFQKYGDLAASVRGTDDIPFKILLSHDPTHWEHQVLTQYPEIDITFSGHTHGLQFGLEAAGIKWSPAQWIYPQWAGLYKQGEQYLYVNRGLGFIGYPGRYGIWPEITVVELES